MPKDPWTDPDPQPGDFDADLASIDPRYVERHEGSSDAPAYAVVVITEQELEESRRDPRVHELFARGDALLAELDAERADF